MYFMEAWHNLKLSFSSNGMRIFRSKNSFFKLIFPKGLEQWHSIRVDYWTGWLHDGLSGPRDNLEGGQVAYSVWMLSSGCTKGGCREISPSMGAMWFRSVPQGLYDLPIWGTRILKPRALCPLAEGSLFKRKQQHKMIEKWPPNQASWTQIAPLVINSCVGKVLNVTSFKALFIFMMRSIVPTSESCEQAMSLGRVGP